jgi:hypothetical protein
MPAWKACVNNVYTKSFLYSRIQRIKINDKGKRCLDFAFLLSWFIQTVAPVVQIGPDFGGVENPANTWAHNFAPTPAPTGTRFVILHFRNATFAANAVLEVDLGYDTDTFTAADGDEFWTRPINLAANQASMESY